MKILSIIGTRPQYIKIKPFYDLCKRLRVDHQIVDTYQHFSPNVSSQIIKDLGLEIDFTLDLTNYSELNFISECLLKINTFLSLMNPNIVMTFGDTNSTFCAALASYKRGIPVAHIEAGERCGDSLVPEEINRLFVDSVSSLKFCSSERALKQVSNGIFCGDLEYEYLNKLDPKISFEEFGVMTIHRQENCNIKQLEKIIQFCSRILIPIKFFVHHRIDSLVRKMSLPSNIQKLEPCSYTQMIDYLSRCSFVLTDSGSLQKISPFFGKSTLVFRSLAEWQDTFVFNFAKRCQFSITDSSWLLSSAPVRDQSFYLSEEPPSKIILSFVEKFLETK